MAARFEIHRDGDEWWFALVAGNGQEVCRSQHYTTRRGAEKGIASVAGNAAAAEIVDVSEDDEHAPVGVTEPDGADAPLALVGDGASREFVRARSFALARAALYG